MTKEQTKQRVEEIEVILKAMYSDFKSLEGHNKNLIAENERLKNENHALNLLVKHQIK